MKITPIVEAMVAAGATPEMILVAVRATEQQMADVLERRRANDRERQKRRRHVTSRNVTVTVPPRASATRVEDKTSNLDIEPQEQEERNARKRASPDSEFDAFWSRYPHKVGKPLAKTKFAAARKRASFDAIMAGLDRYVAKTDDRPWCNPATWLNQDRWADQPATVTPFARGSPQKPTLAAAFGQLSTEMRHQREVRSGTGDGGVQPALLDLSAVRR